MALIGLVRQHAGKGAVALAAYFAWLAGILLGYALPATLMKRFYIRRFGWQ